MSEFVEPTDEELRAEEAAIAYNEACENYDRLVCGNDGIPKNSEQSSLINVNALGVRRQILIKFSVTRDQFQKALRRIYDRRMK